MSPKSFFVGRHKEEELFLTYISSRESQSPLHFVGHGGIGKSSLLRRFLNLSEERDLAAVYVDLGFVQSPPDLLRRLIVSLVVNHSCNCPSYIHQSNRYRRIEADLLEQPSLDKRTVFYLSKLPELLPTPESLVAIEPINIMATSRLHEPVDTLSVYDALPHEDRELFLNPLPILTRAFIEDVVALNRKLIVELDRTEKAPSYLGAWLLRDLLPQIPNILLITAGRDDISHSWNLQNLRVRIYELKPLSNTDAKQYLDKIGITNATTRNHILQSSMGIPLALELASEMADPIEFSIMIGAVETYVVDRMIRVFFDGISSARRQALLRLAIYRWFNRETISWLGFTDDHDMEDMLAIRFMKYVQYGYALHDSIRDFVLRDLKRQEPETYRLLHNQAAEYYKARIGPHVEGNINFLEWLYHMLSADPLNGFNELKKYFTVAALAIKPDFCESVIGVARESDVDGNLPSSWLRFFEGAIKRQRFDFSGANEIYGELLASPDIDHDPELKAELLFQRSVALWYLCQFNHAIVVARESAELNQQLNKLHFRNRSLAIVGLGLDRIGEFGSAIRIVRYVARQAAESDPVSEAYALNSIGYFSWHSGNWRRSEQALMYCRNKWIALKNPLGECYPTGHLGLLYATVQQYPLALETLSKVKKLCERTGNIEMLSKTLQNLSYYYKRTGYIENAWECAQEALATGRRLQHPYYTADSQRLMAEALYDRGDMTGAREAVEAGLRDISNTNAKYLQLRLQILCAEIEMVTMASLGTTNLAVLADRLQSLVATCAKLEFHNLAARAELITIRLYLVHGINGTKTSFNRGVEHAFRYNWYTGIDFLEEVKTLLMRHTPAGGEILEIMNTSFALPKLCELYRARQAYTIKRFEAADMARIATLVHKLC